MTMIRKLVRTALLGLVLAVIPTQRAAAQIVAEAACDPVAGSCDRINFAFNSSTSGEFFSVVIRTSDPNFQFRNDNTDPVGGAAFQIGELYDVDNDELLAWDGDLDAFGTGHGWSSASFNWWTQSTGNFILSLYFDYTGTLDVSTFTFEATGLDPLGEEFGGSGVVSVAGVSQVPEPGTVLLLATGLAGLGVARLRRRRHAVES